VVTDIDAARAELAGRGVEVSEILQLGPEGTIGSRFVMFSDPDGNGWAVQEIRPGDPDIWPASQRRAQARPRPKLAAMPCSADW
jgi:glyoxalase/bleomycin resistance protein/dioxygenase superfamily protein